MAGNRRERSSQRPRIDSGNRPEGQRRQRYERRIAELRAEVDALRRRLSDLDALGERVADLETELASRERLGDSLKACSHCGYVCVRHGIDVVCPRCRKGWLESL